MATEDASPERARSPVAWAAILLGFFVTLNLAVAGLIRVLRAEAESSIAVSAAIRPAVEALSSTSAPDDDPSPRCAVEDSHAYAD